MLKCSDTSFVFKAAGEDVYRLYVEYTPAMPSLNVL